MLKSIRVSLLLNSQVSTKNEFSKSFKSKDATDIAIENATDSKITLSEFPEDLLVLEYQQENKRKDGNHDFLDAAKKLEQVKDFKDQGSELIVKEVVGDRDSMELDMDQAKNPNPVNDNSLDFAANLDSLGCLDFADKKSTASPTCKRLSFEKNQLFFTLNADSHYSQQRTTSKTCKKGFFDHIWDSNIDMTQSLPEGFDSLLIENGQSIGIIIGSLGLDSDHSSSMGSYFANHIGNQLSESLSENGRFAHLDVKILLGRFAFTDCKIVDLIAERNFTAPGFVEADHMQPVDSCDIHAILNDQSLLTVLPSCTVLYFETMDHNHPESLRTGKLYLVDLKQPSFCPSSHQPPHHLSNTISKLSQITSILSTHGREDTLDFSFPLGAFCKEMFGGRARCLIFFQMNPQPPASLSDLEICAFMEFCSQSRKIRSKIEQCTMDGQLQHFKSVSSRFEREKSDQDKEIQEKQAALEQLQGRKVEMEGIIETLQNQVELMKQQIETETIKYKSSQSELLSKYQRIDQEFQSHILECEGQETKLIASKIKELQDLLDESKQEFIIQTSLMKLEISKRDTLVLDYEDKARVLETKNAVLEYENQSTKSTLSHFSSLHEQEIASITECKKETQLYKSQNAEISLSLESEKARTAKLEAQISGLQEETRLLGSKLVMLQDKALDSQGALHLESSKQDHKLFNKVVEYTRDLENARRDLKQEKENNSRVQDTVAEKEKKVSQLKEKLAVMTEQRAESEGKLQVFEKENSRLLKLIQENGSSETRKGVEEVVKMLEQMIANPSSADVSEYKTKLDEMRQVQNSITNSLEKLSTAASSMPIPEKKAKKAPQKESKPVKAKRTIEEIDNDFDQENVESSKKGEKAPKKKSNGQAVAILSAAAKEPSQKAKKPKATKAKHVAVASKTSDDSFDELNELSDENSTQEETAKPSPPPNPKTSIKKITASNNGGVSSKENKEPKPKGFLSKIMTDTSKTNLTGGGLLGSIWKRPEKSTESANSETSGVLPKIPASYLKNRRMDVVFGSDKPQQ